MAKEWCAIGAPLIAMNALLATNAASCRLIRSSLLMLLCSRPAAALGDPGRALVGWMRTPTDRQLKRLSVDQKHACRWHAHCPFAHRDFGPSRLKDSSLQITPSALSEKEVC